MGCSPYNDNFYIVSLMVLCMNSKKGQVSFFVIFAVLLVGVLVVFFVLRKPSDIDGGFGSDSAQAGEIYSFFDGCVKELFKEGAFDVTSDLIFYVSDGIVAPTGELFYYYDGTSWGPDIGFFERAIGAYVDEQMMGCVDYLRELGYDFEMDKGISPGVSFTEDMAVVRYVYSGVFEKQGVSYELSDFPEAEIETSFGKMHAAALGFVAHYSEGGGVPMGFLLDLEDETGIYSEVEIRDGYVVIILVDEEGLDGGRLEYVFAVEDA